MIDRGAVLGCVGVLLAGCGPEAAAVEFAELCGVSGPVRVLELPPDEQLRFGGGLRVGDRVLYLVSKLGPAEADDLFPKVSARTVWSTGPCGEAPVQLATGIDSIFTVEAWPGVVLACEEDTGNILSLDPSGAQEPRVVFADVAHTFGCGLRWTEHGLLSVERHDDELGALLLHPYPVDPRAGTAVPRVLLDPIRVTASGVSGSNLIANVVRTFDDHVLAVTPDDTLVQVELADGVVTALEPGVTAFEASPGGGHILWQDNTVTREHPELPEGKIFLRDQATGSKAFLAETALAFSLFPLLSADQGVVELGLGYFNREPKRVYFLPELDYIELPTSVFLNGRLDDGRWLTSSWSDGYYNLVDLRGGGEATRLFEREGEIVRLDDEAATIHEVPQCCIVGTYRDEGAMWRVPLDGSAPEQVAARASRLVRWTADGRFITPVSIDEQWLAPLLLVDPETQAEQRLDDRVFAFSVSAGWTGEDDIISYSVSDGERSGVYLARLPPRSRTGQLTPPREVEARVVDMLPGPDGRATPRPRLVTDSPYLPPRVTPGAD